MNPYFDQTFGGFFLTLVKRLFLWPSSTLQTDELQLLVLFAISLSAALVGTFLVLKRMTMVANSLSHTILLGVVLAYWLSQDRLHPNLAALLGGSVAVGFLTSFSTEFLVKRLKVGEEAATALVFTTLFALGIIFVTILTHSSHIGTEAVMGNIDALHREDLTLAFWILVLNGVLTCLFFKEYKLITFDAPFSRFLGFSPQAFNYLLMAQISLTTVAAFRAVGVLMVLAFMTAPPLMAAQVTSLLWKRLAYASLMGCLCSLLGVALSRHVLTVADYPLSTAGLVIFWLALFLALHILYAKIKA